MDSATRVTNRRGAAARLAAGELAGAELARAARVDPTILSKLEAMGAVAPKERGARGRAAAWREELVPVVCVLGRMLDIAPNLPVDRFLEVAGLLDGQERPFYNPGRFIVASVEHEARVISWDHLAQAIKRWQAAVVVIELSDVGRVWDIGPAEAA